MVKMQLEKYINSILKMNNLDKKYTDLLQDILNNGIWKDDRTGTGTKSVFGRTIRHKMSEGFPLLTTKKMPWKTMVTELIWFLRGDTNIRYLVQNGCNIWNGDAYKAYEIEMSLETCRSLNPQLIREGAAPEAPITTLSMEEFVEKIKTDDEFAKEWGELGPIYGAQWRKWNTNIPYSIKTGDLYPSGEFKYDFTTRSVDQIANLIHDLKNNPDSRRLMVNAWNVGELGEMTLPPCHYNFQCYTRELNIGERKDYAINVLGYNSLLDYGHSQNDDVEILEAMDDWGIPEREISLIWNQRSVDTFLGLPFNIASYGLLLEILAKEVNMIPGELIGNLGDTHLYLNHLEQAKEQIGADLSDDEYTQALKDADLETFNKIVACRAEKDRAIKAQEYELAMKVRNEEVALIKSMPTVEFRTRTPLPLPTLDIRLHFENEPSFVPEHWLVGDFDLKDYKSHPQIKAHLSN